MITRRKGLGAIESGHPRASDSPRRALDNPFLDFGSSAAYLPPDRDEEARAGPKHAEQHPLGEQLLQQAEAVGTDGDAQRHLSLSGRGTH